MIHSNKSAQEKIQTKKINRVVLVQKNLENVVLSEISEPYKFCWYQSGFQKEWERINQIAGGYPAINPGLFAKEFENDEDSLKVRQCYVKDSKDELIATATGWQGTWNGRQMGRVHWVAVLPNHQHRGLGRIMVLTVCRRMKELGHEEIYVVAHADNKAAIQLYLDLGFQRQGPE